MPGTDRKIMPEKLQDENGNDSDKRGLLAPLTDPVGKVLNAGLSPLGAGVGALTGSVAEGAATVTGGLQEKAGIPDRGVEKEKEQNRKERIGGKEPSAENPMGL